MSDRTTPRPFHRRLGLVRGPQGQPGGLTPLPGDADLVLAGDLEAYRRLRGQLEASARPSDGDDLLGMQVDVEHYLGPDGPFGDDHLLVTTTAGEDEDEPDPGVIRGYGTWSEPDPGGRERRRLMRERAQRLSQVWTDELAYQHAQAHVVTAAWGGSLCLRGVTQIGPGEFFVTVLLEVRPEPA